MTSLFTSSVFACLFILHTVHGITISSKTSFEKSHLRQSNSNEGEVEDRTEIDVNTASDESGGSREFEARIPVIFKEKKTNKTKIKFYKGKTVTSTTDINQNITTTTSKSVKSVPVVRGLYTGIKSDFLIPIPSNKVELSKLKTSYITRYQEQDWDILKENIPPPPQHTTPSWNCRQSEKCSNGLIWNNGQKPYIPYGANNWNQNSYPSQTQRPYYPAITQRPYPNYPYPGNNNPYPGNNKPYPGNNNPYPGNNNPYPGNNKPYPGNNNPYPGNNNPYPGNNNPNPGNNNPYPGNNNPNPGNNNPYPGNNNPYPGNNNPYPGNNHPYPGNNNPYPGGGCGTGQVYPNIQNSNLSRYPNRERKWISCRPFEVGGQFMGGLMCPEGSANRATLAKYPEPTPATAIDDKVQDLPIKSGSSEII